MKNIIMPLIAATMLLLVGVPSIAHASGAVNVDIFEGETATVNSYLFSNGESLVVMDVQRSTAEAKKLAEMIKNKGLPLTHILVSHGHPDHYTGMSWLLKQFPKAKIVVANEDIKKDILAFSTWMESVGWLDAEPLLKPKSEKQPNGFDYLNNINVLPSNKLSMIGGGELTLSTHYSPAEAEHVTTVYVDDINGLFTSDLAYNKVHLWMGQGVTKKHVANWRAMLRTFRSEYTQLNPKVYPGHGKPSDITLFDTLVTYIDDFNHITATANSKEMAMKKMKALYPDYKEAGFLLKYSVDNHMK
ncbi:MBL fold metallo-hydrolase [Colwellia psychrerythraea]|uniref:Beta-lactamase domain protein n=1 Tax=Colwellia psychrerythraea TaxID=28229 RepID=A0A099KED3_COLPS|nr:MBL fold metallo-hydrolase [Colwellia psychrerythraea]KGJ88625.1 beta-lactamase domain protein [Colwellia psychrerythraea]